MDVGWKLSETELRQWLDSLLTPDRSVVAPVWEDGILLFREISTEEQVVIAPSGKPRWSPKEFLFPRSEPLYRYRWEGGQVIVDEPQSFDGPRVLFAVRSCDAAGLKRLDEVFLEGTRDPFYAARREGTTIVSAACAAPDAECLCTAVGGSPVGEEGCDIQLVPLGDGWLLRVLTERGRDLLGDATGAWRAAEKGDGERLEELAREVGKEIRRSPVLKEWSRILEEGFAHEAWDRLAAMCLGCSVCAYVCPSCSCFDMNHEANAWCGEQCRSWDACTYARFTLHASGHNPRATRQERFRQRVLHKFAFREADEEPFRCVGCGRCVALCPAGLDIVATVAAAVDAIREEGSDATG